MMLDAFGIASGSLPYSILPNMSCAHPCKRTEADNNDIRVEERSEGTVMVHEEDWLLYAFIL